ncbi:agmatine coumaroyltransferase-2-like [Panicum miliaceum]|uniref:Agmatine coumaroyltransferase-2-like n=1 Tax=Panicum miliaceum TaxID=4540 RepID=A0A3L6SMP6_PANMI|nr:agmatine coumaroyltransferase-2-like [Panicum miliaceum]
MKITVQSSRAVRPDYGSGVGAGGAGADDAVPLSVFDKANFDTYVSVIYVFRPPMPPNAALEAGLARALAEYREWAGRLGVDARGNRAILLTDEGARFVEATADVTLHSVLPLRPTREVTSLHPSSDGAELMLIQVTRFACGSVAVGFTAQHLVSDGRATSNFFVAWSQATRGAAVDPAPAHDRASFFAPRDPPLVEFEHRGVEFKRKEQPAPRVKKSAISDADADADDEVVVHKVHFSREFIAKLKSQASPPGTHRPCSTLRCVVAHLWRCVTAARGLGAGVSTSVCIAVDGRVRMTPPVPEGYTGNVVLWARPTATARDLVTRPLQHAVELINRGLARVNESYFRSFVDFASSGAVEEEGLVPTADAADTVLSPNIEVDSWLRMPFYELDFGGGRPFFFMPSYVAVEGLLIILPSYFGDGSIDAYVPLFSRHMDNFKNLCYSMSLN